MDVMEGKSRDQEPEATSTVRKMRSMNGHAQLSFLYSAGSQTLE